MTVFNVNQIQALALLTAGYSSEVKNKSSFELSLVWSKNKETGVFEPIGNSGYSVGVNQTDFGAQPDKVAAFVTAYQQWAGSDPTRLVGSGVNNLIATLSSGGKQLFKGTDAQLLSNPDKAKLNAFLDSVDGRQTVWNLDMKQLDIMQVAAQRLMQTPGFNGFVSDDDKALVLGVYMKAVNQGGERKGSLASDLYILMSSGSVSWNQIQDVAHNKIFGDKDYYQTGFDGTKSGALLYAKILASNTPLSPWLQDLSSQHLTVLGQAGFAADPRFQVLERLFRDTVSGSKFVDSIASGTPALMTLPAGLSGQAKIIGVDKGGTLFSADSDGSNFKKYTGGQWINSFGNYPRSDLPILKSVNGSMVLALGNEQIELGNTALAQVNINGTTVTLDANKPGQYAFMQDGVLIRASFSANLAVESGEVLTGQFANSTYVRNWREGNPNLQLGFAADTAILSAQLNTLTTFTDGAGKTIEIDSLPVKTNVNGQLVVNGVQNITTTKLNGIVQSVVQKIDTTDPETKNREISTDAVLNSVAGQFGSHTKSSTVTSASGAYLNKLDITYNAQSQITETKLSESQPDSTLLITIRNGQGVALSTTRNQTFDDGSTLDIKTDHLTGQESVKATDALNATREANLPTTTQSQALIDNLYSGATSFFNALRTGDKLGQMLAMGQMVSSYAKLNNGNTAQFDSFLGGVSASIGIYGALNGLQSKDLSTQLNSAVNLFRSGDALYRSFNNNASYLSQDSLKLLDQFGAVLSIANLGNIGQMLDNGQVGSAMATAVGAINGAAFLGGATTTITGTAVSGGVSAAGGAAFIPMDPYTLIAFVVITVLLDEAFKKTPPPPPPTGQATLKTLADGSISYDINNAAHGGADILTEKMNALVNKLNAQLDYANGKTLTGAQITTLGLTAAQVTALPTRPNLASTAPDQLLTLVASRAPRITIQSWPAYAPANLSTNYFFVTEASHPQTGQKYNMGVARQDLVGHYGEALAHPQALVAKWEVDSLTAKFGATQANWKTEGQWLGALSPIEQQRLVQQAAITAAQATLTEASKNTLSLGAFVGDGDITGNTFLQAAPNSAAVQAAEAALAAAKGARIVFEAQNPSKFNPFDDKEGLNPQAAAHIVGTATVNAAKNNPANQDLQNALVAARQGASHQWLKVIALDWGNDGITRQALPASVGTRLEDLQNDGVARFDADNDGYREATEWLAPSEAMLGLDRDNNGALDSANELFNGVNTPYDQRGWAGLKYYDSNGDGKITEADPVYKQLRLWFDLNGNGSAGDLEVLDLKMNYVGADMAALRARLDAIGQAALTALAQTGIESIDLVTMQVRLKNAANVNASEQKLQSEVKGIAVAVDTPTQNISIIHEDGLRENYITVVQDMSVLMELQNVGLSAQRRAQLEAMALQYGLNPQSADFMKVVKSLRAGGENVGGTGQTVFIGSNDVWTDPNLRTRLEQMSFRFDAVVDVGGSDVYGTATLQKPEYAGPGTAQTQGLDPWAASVVVNQSQVTSAPGAAAVTPRVEMVVLSANVYTLDVVVRGAQLGGLATQQAVLVSNPVTGLTQEVQLFTTSAPVGTLAGSSLAGREDERFGFSYLQLELEARAQIGGAATVRLIGMKSASHGWVDEATGRATFIPDANYFGNDAGFTYLVMDNLGRVLERRVTISLTAVNDAPTLVGETVAAKEDVPLLLSAANLLANDSDLEGDTFTIVGIGRVGMGQAQLLSNGQIRYLPPADLYGITDTVEYLVRDARGATAVGVVKITLSPVDDAPTVVSELIRKFDEDTNLRIDPAMLLANDYDTDFNRAQGAGQLRVTAVSNAATNVHGDVFLDGNGDIIFVPDANYHGKANFNYTVTDETGLSTTGSAEVEIAPVNDAPVVAGEIINSQEDTPLRIDPDVLLLKDKDVDILGGEAQTLRVVAVDQAINGTVTVDNGLITFTPILNFSGVAGFRYAVGDGADGFTYGNATVNVAAVNDAPVAPNRSFTGTEDTALVISTAQLLAGVIDVETGTTGLDVHNVGNAQGGTVVLASGNYTFTPNANYNGVAGFDYSVKDAQGASTMARVTLNLNAVNDAPVFIASSSLLAKQGEEDQAVRIASAAILGLFADVDGDAISLDVASLSVVSAGDTVSFDAVANEVVFKAAPNANGVRQFNVKVKDSNGALSANKALGVNFQALNDAPLVNAVGFQMLEDAGHSYHGSQGSSYLSYSSLLANASDVDGDTLSVAGFGAAWTSSGTTVYLSNEPANGRVAILAPLNFNGHIAFNYSVTDGKGATVAQTAYGYVAPVNDMPVAWLGSVIQSGWGNWPSNLTQRQDPMQYIRIDSYDVEQPAETLVTSIIAHPWQVPVWQGITYSHTNSWWYAAEYGSGESFSQTVESYAPTNYFALANWISGGASQNEYLGVRVYDWHGGYGDYTHTFWAQGYDPIIIDLGSDGVEFIGLEASQAKFDRDGNGTLERTAWVKNTEAILAWDNDGDGQINRINEIEFWTHVSNQSVPLTDMQALGQPEFDANQDGKFDALDPKWSQFKFWRDLNEDGKSQAGELQTMAGAGVKALHLYSNVLNRRYESGVTVRGYSRLEMTDGRMLQAADVQFNADDPSIPLAPSPTVPVNNAVPTDAAQAEAWFNNEAENAAAKRRIGDAHFSGAPRDQRVLTGEAYFYQLPSTLLPVNGAGQQTRVTLANGSALPAWLAFNAVTGVLSGNAPFSGTQDWHLKIERFGGSVAPAQVPLTLSVVDANQAPLVHGKVPTQFATEKVGFSLEIAPNFFMDLDGGDSLALKATLADGSALPQWLQFDAANGRFFGTPLQADVRNLAIRLTAVDEANAAATTQFNLIVTPVNDAPVLNRPLATVTMKIGQSTSVVLPYDMFVETDVDDSFSVSVARQDGSALPTWLAFNPTNRTFSGTPNQADLAAPVSVRVTATDLAGLRTSTVVTFTSSIFGTTANDTLNGTAFNEDLFGDAGDDVLDGKAGGDAMAGGAGNDTYVVDNAGDLVAENLNEGVDTVWAQISYTLGANQENLVLDTAAAINGYGNELNNYMYAGAGSNIMTGGTGNDWVDFTKMASGVTVNLALATAQNTGGSGVDTLSGFENIYGSLHNDVLYGDSGANYVYGYAGADTLAGGAGNDVYYVENAGDVVVELAGEGVDTVYTNLSYTLGINQERVVLDSAGAINGYGNELSNDVYSGSGNNVMDGGAGVDWVVYDRMTTAGVTVSLALTGAQNTGGAGTDTLLNFENLQGSAFNDVLTGDANVNTLRGRAGNDILDGGAGTDTLIGDSGDDTYVVDNIGDVVTELASEGTDTIQTNLTYSLASLANVENLTLTGTSAINATGNAANNVLTGNSGNNTLDGGLGADTMAGGGGDDVYYVDSLADVVVELAGGTLNDFVYTSVSRTIDADVEGFVASGATGLTLTGDGRSNWMYGWSSAFADTLIGGAGDDHYRVHANDVIVEAANAGWDYVRGAFNIALTAYTNVEGGVLEGAGDFSLTGDANANTLVGNTGNNTLTGGGGNDTIHGGAGFDTAIFSGVRAGYTITRSGTLVTVVGAEGTDILSNVEKLAFSDASVSLTASSSDFQGDGVSDILWRNVMTGDNAIYRGANNLNQQTVITVGDLDWEIAGTGDFNGDAIADILWRNAGTGANSIWRGASNTSIQGITTVAEQTWRVAGVGDFNGDGTADILWRNSSSGLNTIWKSADSTTQQAVTSVADLTWKVAGVGDFNRDGVADILWRNASSGGNVIWSGGNSAAQQLVTIMGDLNWKVVAIGDFNGDGAADIFWRNSATGGNTIWKSADSGQVMALPTQSDLNWKVYGTGDYNGDGVSDVLWRNTATGAQSLWTNANFATPQAVITVADQAWIIPSQSGTWRETNLDVYGDAGNNLLRGNSGANMIDGAAGADTADYSQAIGAVTVNLAFATAQNTIGAGLDTLANLENLTGSAFNDQLTGNSGDNILNGLVGADTMAAGAGEDTYYVDNVGDVVIENANEGTTDIVYSDINYVLGPNVERIYMAGSAAINATGNALDNVLYGRDVVGGNPAANVLSGGLGNDIYYVGAGDTVVEALNSGTDAVVAFVDFSLGANQENLQAGTTAPGVRLVGNELSNTILGGVNADTIEGGLGDDLLNGAAGTDTLSYASATAGITMNLALTTAQVTGGAGTDTVSNFENLAGSAFNDVLTGNAGANVLEGGNGMDHYYIDSLDTVVETATGGFDYVWGSFGNLALANYANVEAAVLQGSANLNVTGRADSNSLFGNTGNNVVNGDAGSDYMEGRGGNDTFMLARGHGADTIYEDEVRVGDADIAQYDATVAKDQLWFRQVSNHLEVSVIGASDKVTIANWYLGNQYHIEQFKTSDGKTLLDSQVQNLVSAMAAFAPPAAGQTTLPANYATALAPVIAANWV